MTGESVVSAGVGISGAGRDEFGAWIRNVHGGGGIDDGDRRDTGANEEVVALERKRRKKKKRRGRRRVEEKQQKDHTPQSKHRSERG